MRPCQIGILQHDEAMPNWNFVKRQLKFDIPRYLFTKTHIPKTKTRVLRQKQALFIYLVEKNIIIICNNGLNYLL